MKKTILAIAVVLMMAAVGIAAAAEEGVGVEGSVSNINPVVGQISVDSLVLADGTIPIDSVDGATFTITSTIEDMNGADTVVGANCYIYDSSNTEVMMVQMGLTYVDTTNTEASAAVTLPETTEAGTYTIKVVGIDTDGAHGEGSTDATFTTSTDPKFSVSPLLLPSLVPGSTVTAEFSITMNYGASGEVFTVDSATFGAITVTDVVGNTDTIPAENIQATVLPSIVEIGVPATVQVSIDVPVGTRSGDLSGSGTLVISTN